MSLERRDLGRIVGLWAVWSAATLVLAAAAARLPVATENPWPPEVARIAPPLGFYPLYPLLVRWTVALTHTPLFETGIALSLACLLGALLLLADLAAEWGRAESVLPTVGCLLLFPTAYYFAAFYTESLFLLTTVAVVWAARRRRWVVAGLAGFAASLTRLNGLLTVLPIAYEAWRSTEGNRRRLLRAPAVGVAGPLLGAAVFPASAILFLLLLVFVFKKKLTLEGLYVAATLLLLLNSGTIDAMDRYVLVLFPCFFVLAEFLRQRPALAFAYGLCGVGFGVIFLTRFVHWLFVA